jgi:hypothetical protein
MNSGVLNFAIGMTGNEQVVQGLSKTSAAVTGLTNHARNFSAGIEHMGSEMIGTREKVEILRNSLDNMGGSLGGMGGLVRLALDPMTLGFAAVFAATELWNHSLDRAHEKMVEFAKAGEGVEAVIRAIIALRPTGDEQWMQTLELAARAGEKHSNIKAVSEGFTEVTEGMDQNKADAANEQLELEQKKIELLQEQGKISEADAAKRIEALQDQMVLQKNLNERTAIQDQIKSRQSDLQHVNEVAAKSPSETEAIQQKIIADAKADDLTKQVTDLPKAIAAAKNEAKLAEENAKNTSYVPDKGAWTQKKNFAETRAQQLQDQYAAAQVQLPGAISAATNANENLDNARTYKSRKAELTDQITGLQNKYGVTVDRQKRMTPLEFESNRIDAAKKKKIPNAYNPESAATNFEKMGFVMGGKANPFGETNDILKNILGALRGSRGGQYNAGSGSNLDEALKNAI